MSAFLFPTIATLAGTWAIVLLARRDRATRGAGLRHLDPRGFVLAAATLAAGLALMLGDGEPTWGRSVQAAERQEADWKYSGDRGPNPDEFESLELESWTHQDETLWQPLDGIGR